MMFITSGLLQSLMLFAMFAHSGDASADQASKYRHLLDKAKVSGHVRVIIGLKMPEYKPEGELSGDTAVKAQREQIARLQDDLLEKLSEYKISSVKRYAFSPFVAMQIDMGGLQIVINDRQISSIEEDTAVQISH